MMPLDIFADKKQCKKQYVKVCIGFIISFALLLPLHLYPGVIMDHCPLFIVKAVIFAALLLLLFSLARLLQDESFSIHLRCIFLFFSSGIFLVLIKRPLLNWGGDYAHYILAAQALKDGTLEELGQRILHMQSYDHLHKWIVPQHLPMGFPCMLRAAMQCGLTSPFHLGFVSLLCLALLPVIFWIRFSNELKGNFIYIFLLFTIFNCKTLYISFFPLSDIPFLLFSCAALLLADYLFLAQYQNHWAKRAVMICLLILLCAFSSMLRAGGLALIPCIIIAWVTCFFRHKSFRTINAWLEIIVFVISVTAITIWIRSIFPCSNESIFRDSFQNISGDLFFKNLSRYLKYGTRVTPFSRTFIGYAFFGVSLICVLISIRHRYKTHSHIICWCLFNFIPLLFLSFRAVRYLLPILPFFIWAAYDGAVLLWSRIKSLPVRYWEKLKILKPYFPHIAHGTLLLLIICGCWNCMQFVSDQQILLYTRSAPDAHPSTTASKQMFNYLSQNCGPAEQIGCTKPRTFYLFTKRDCVYYAYPIPFGDCAHYCLKRSDLKRQKVSVQKLLDLYPDYCVSFENEGFVLFSKKPNKQKP